MMSSISRSDYEVTELRWENGQVAMNGLGHEPSSKQTWGSLKSGDTLESLVHQATLFPVQNDSNDDQWRQNPGLMNMDQLKNDDHKVNSLNPILPISSSGAKWNENIKQNEIKAQANPWRHITGEEKGLKNSSSVGKYGHDSSPGGSVKNKKAINGENNYCMMRKNSYDQEVEEGASGRSGCASESATFCRDQTTDTTMMTWPSFESPPISSHAASENQDGEPVPNGESFRSQSSARSSRAAAVHNQSERRRRDRINQKMKALQKLVPNASKTDKASMLDEVIEYLKQLQTQIRMMSNARSIMPQMMMPLGMQQQIQMSYLARMGIGMGMGMGMGMVDVNNLARNTLYPIGHAAPPPLGGTAPFLPPSFSMPPVVPPPSSLKSNVDAANAFVPNFGEAYKTLLAQQSMNMDFFNKVAALYGQQTNQQSDKPVSISQPDNGQ